jgi:hypothetical protein
MRRRAGETIMPSMCMQSMSNGQNTCCYLPTRAERPMRGRTRACGAPPRPWRTPCSTRWRMRSTASTWGRTRGVRAIALEAALLPVCYQLAALWQPSPTCWMSPLGEWSNDRGLCEPLSHRMRRSLTAGGGPCPHAIHSPRAYCEHGQWAVARNHGSGF